MKEESKVSDETTERQNISDDEIDHKEMIENLSLPVGVLDINTGFPIVIICNKSDLIQFGEAQDYYKANFDFIMTKI